MTKELNEKEQESKELTPQEAQNLIKTQEGFDDLIPDERLLGVFESTLSQIEDDRNEIDEALREFLNMVLNDGDATAASKEAVVSLLKLKTDTSDKIIKVADLMTRIKLKERNTFPKYMAPSSVTNQYNFGEQKSEDQQKKALLAEIDTAKNKGK